MCLCTVYFFFIAFGMFGTHSLRDSRVEGKSLFCSFLGQCNVLYAIYRTDTINNLFVENT